MAGNFVRQVKLLFLLEQAILQRSSAPIWLCTYAPSHVPNRLEAGLFGFGERREGEAYA
jgi:hypothetical protein